MINALIVVGFTVLMGWMAQELVGVSSLLVGGMVVLCGACTYLGKRLR